MRDEIPVASSVCEQLLALPPGVCADAGQLGRHPLMEQFFAQAPAMNPARSLVTGVICGVRIEEIEEPTMREIRIMDKLVDELAKGRKMEKILRSPAPADR